MHILFLILKIAGILILAVLVLVAVILFYPVSYKADGSIEKKQFHLDVNWLFRIVHFELRFDGKLYMLLRILFLRFPFTDPEWKAAREIKKQKKAEKKKKAKQKKLVRDLKKRERKHRKIKLDTEDPDTEHLNPEMPDKSAGVEAEPESAVDSEEETGNSKISDISAKVRRVMGILKDMRNQNVMSFAWPALQKLLLRIKPSDLTGEITFGFADPATTGEVVGGITMIPFLYEMHLVVIPDFEADKTYALGEVSAKGKIRIFYIVVFLIRLLKEKQFRIFIRHLFHKKK